MALEDSIKQHEGYREHPYRDTRGYWTVGWGHLIHNDSLDDLMINGATVGDLFDYLTDEQMHKLWFKDDVADAAAGAERWIDNTTVWDTMPAERQNVLIEMVYQLGYGGISKFRKTRQHIIDGHWLDAADEMLDSKWARQTPGRASELSKRFRGRFD